LFHWLCELLTPLKTRQLAPTPLHQAVVDDAPDKVQVLIDSDVDLTATNSYEQTATQLAKFLHRQECLALLDQSKEPTIFFLGKDSAQTTLCTTKELGKLTGMEYLQHLKFQSPEQLQKASKECKGRWNKHQFTRRQEWLSELYKDNILEGHVCEATIQWIDSTVGYGAFTNHPLSPGDFVGEYTGVVRNYRSADFNAYCFEYPTLYWFRPTLMVDANQSGSLARFINHNAQPNLEPLPLYAGGVVHIILVAKEHIEAGSQLTYDYGADYWTFRSRPKRFS